MPEENKEEKHVIEVDINLEIEAFIDIIRREVKEGSVLIGLRFRNPDRREIRLYPSQLIAQRISKGIITLDDFNTEMGKLTGTYLGGEHRTVPPEPFIALGEQEN